MTPPPAGGCHQPPPDPHCPAGDDLQPRQPHPQPPPPSRHISHARVLPPTARTTTNAATAPHGGAPTPPAAHVDVADHRLNDQQPFAQSRENRTLPATSVHAEDHLLAASQPRAPQVAATMAAASPADLAAATLPAGLASTSVMSTIAPSHPHCQPREHAHVSSSNEFQSLLAAACGGFLGPATVRPSVQPVDHGGSIAWPWGPTHTTHASTLHSAATHHPQNPNATLASHVPPVQRGSGSLTQPGSGQPLPQQPHPLPPNTSSFPPPNTTSCNRDFPCNPSTRDSP